MRSPSFCDFPSRREDVQCARRQGDDKEIVIAEYEALRFARKILRAAIGKSKKRIWEELFRSLEKDPWGCPYKFALDKLRSTSDGDKVVTTFPFQRRSYSSPRKEWRNSRLPLLKSKRWRKGSRESLKPLVQTGSPVRYGPTSMGGARLSDPNPFYGLFENGKIPQNGRGSIWPSSGPIL